MSHYLGLLAFLILLPGLIFVAWRWPRGRAYTFSQHVAAHRPATLYYIALFSIVLPILLAFFYRWFMPTLKLSPWFGVFVVIVSITQLGCTLIPETGGKKSTYHRALAGISGFCLLPCLIFLLHSPSVAAWEKVITGMSIAVMCGILWTAGRGRGKHPQLLLLQSGYFFAFFVPVLCIAYL